MGVEKLTMVLVEKQTDRITPETTLGHNDFCDVIEAAKLTISPDVEQDNRGSSAFDNYPPTVGRTQTEIGLAFGLHSLGSGGNPDFIRCLECAGWQRRLDAGWIKMHPISEIINAATVWGYYGGPGTQKAFLEKFGNVMFDGSIALEAGKRALMRLTGKGKYLSPPARATMPNIAAWRERVTSPALQAASTIYLNGIAYGFIKGEITFGQAVEANVDATDTYGGGDTEITDRKMEWSATVYQKIDTSFIPHTNLFAGATGIFDFQWGKTYHTYDMRLYALKSTLTDVKAGNNNGVNTWELKGIFEENSLELWIYNATGSSYSSASTSASSDSNSSVSDSSSSDSSASTSSNSLSV